MHSHDFALIAAFFALVLLPAPWLGHFYYKVMEGQRTWLSVPLQPVEKLCYRFAGIDAQQQQTWQRYALALLAFNLAGFGVLFAILPSTCRARSGPWRSTRRSASWPTPTGRPTAAKPRSAT
jgi:K+-transporting ATPase ATPase A chain